MIPNRFGLVLAAAICVGVAGAGSYLATRQGLAAASPAVVVSSPAPVAPPAPLVSEPAALRSSDAAKPSVSPRVAPRARVVEREAAPPVERPPADASRRETPAVALAPAPPAAAPPEPVVTAEPTIVVDATPATSADVAPEPLAVKAEPAVKTLEERKVAADSVIGLQSETTVSSERAKIEDRVEAKVVRDVMVDGAVAIPAGTRVIGSVTVVDRGGKFRERARLGIRFNTLMMADGTRVAIETDTIYRYGDTPSDKSAAKIGGATAAGAILGAMLGGSKGAAIGATTGAGAGTAAVMAGKPNAATFPAGVEVTARLTSPVTVTVENE